MTSDLICLKNILKSHISPSYKASSTVRKRLIIIMHFSHFMIFLQIQPALVFFFFVFIVVFILFSCFFFFFFRMTLRSFTSFFVIFLCCHDNIQLMSFQTFLYIKEKKIKTSIKNLDLKVLYQFYTLLNCNLS